MYPVHIYTVLSTGWVRTMNVVGRVTHESNYRGGTKGSQVLSNPCVVVGGEISFQWLLVMILLLYIIVILKHMAPA